MLLQLYIATNLVLLGKASAITDDVGTTTLNFTTTEVSSSYAEKINVNATTTTERPQCGRNQWQCADGACVPQESKCDGAFHCEDGSDETRANCKNTTRDMLGLLFHCTADKWNLKDGVCPDICKLQTEYCGYALMAEQKPAVPGVCVLPDFIKNGNYTIINLNKTSEFGFNDFALDYNCNKGTELVGEKNPACINGTWNSEMPYCSETCHLKNMSKYKYKYTCTRGDIIKPCGEFMAIGTEITVEKNDTKISNSSIKAYAMCTEDRVLNISKDCVEVVEARQDKYEKDVMRRLSDFENKFKETTHPSFAFEELVKNYRTFETQVNKNSTDLKIEVTVCDIYLDFMEMSQGTGGKTKEGSSKGLNSTSN